jgi:hypothetical protein
MVVRSEFPLPELLADDSGDAECSVSAGSPPGHPTAERWDHQWRSAAGEVVLCCAREGDTYRLGVPHLATFLIEDGGRTVTCRPHRPLPPGTLEHLLIDQVLPRVLTYRGRLVLHAGCVVTPAGAIAFLGDSGAGKSTLCAEFARAGNVLLGDDGIAIRGTAVEGFTAVATYPGLRLLPDPLARLFDERAGSAPVAHYTAKRRLDRAHAGVAMTTDPHPLRALYVLSDGPEIAVSPLPPREAFMALVRGSFQLHLDDKERSRELFERIGALQQAVPTRCLTYPREFSRLGDVREAVLADVAMLAIPAGSAGCACS